ncbi:arylsulfatase [Aliifodinibius sp. S!AR15-10]|uniref:arylsulfatase n=1 Tax=Aliifodinibius sp. S!AR15-10 TaxID=2950437 RepID=UPI002855294D|nr:arylsulfatase [Aliifodinibius sp. S!AR15-10]MDR8394554.1 arylsulfatase [Aliifodinibius sp. S!AR15-10]
MQIDINTLSIRLFVCIWFFYGWYLSVPENNVIAKSKDELPNVILILTDDQGYGDIAAHGNPTIKTPYIDKFYSESVRFTNFHVGTTCSPTRAMLMTGRYNNRVGVWHTVGGRSLLFQNETTLPEVFKKAGYKTGMFGKWHLGDNYPFLPHNRGFDEALYHGGGAISNTPDYWSNDLFDDTYYKNGKPQKYEGYANNIWFNEAIKFIEENRDHPFFLYIPTNVPHWPHRAPDRYEQMYAHLGQQEKDRKLDKFYGQITNIDDNLKRLDQRIRELGLHNNTIFIFMTDNGTVKSFHYNAGMRGQKGSEYDGGHRVPFFIRYPTKGIKGGTEIDKLTGVVDIFPTLVNLSGIASDGKIEFDGKSLVPLLRGETKNWSDRIMFVDTQRRERPQKWKKTAVLKGDWRLVNGSELYNIESDPGQKNNIAHSHPGLISELTEAYNKYWNDISTNFGKVARIKLGAKEANPTWLNTHDIHGMPRWLQDQVEVGLPANGYWAVEVVEAGRYEITLRRWPPEVKGKTINENLFSYYRTRRDGTMKELKHHGATYARLKLSDFDVDKEISNSDTEVTFSLKLDKGKTRLQAWFVDGNTGRAVWSAYYVGVKRLTD